MCSRCEPHNRFLIHADRPTGRQAGAHLPVSACSFTVRASVRGMDDERQTLNELLAKRPFGEQDLNDVLDSYNDMSDEEKLALAAEILSNLNIDLSSIQRILESESVQRALEHVATPLIQFAEKFSLKRWLRGTILKYTEDRLQSGKLNENDVRHLTEHRNEFQSRFDSDNPWRTEILILLAFAIRSRGEASESVKQELKRDFIEPAHEGRRADRVQDIIDFRALDLLKRTAKKWVNFRGKINFRGIAAAILPAVNEDILKLQNEDLMKVPSTWRVPKTIADCVKSTDAEIWKKKAIDRVAHRIKKSLDKTNDICPIIWPGK